MTEGEARTNIAANLRRILATKDFSLRELSRRADIPINSLSRIVRGLNEPKIAIVATLADALETTVDRLLMPPKLPAHPAAGPTAAENFSKPA